VKPTSPSLGEHGLRTAPTRKLRKIGGPMINCGSQDETDE